MLSKHWKHLLPQVIIIAIILIGAGLRFHHLGVQSFWYDEGVAYGHSQRNLLQLIPALQNNVHVPAYFASLSLWENFVGDTEFGLRAYSALWSIVGIAVAYALGKRLFHPIAALAAGAFVAFNSFSVYYAQEARMYAMLATISALSMWVFAGFVGRLLKPHSGDDTQSSRDLWVWGFTLAGLNILGEYTHVSFALVMLAQGVMALLALINLLYRGITGQAPIQRFVQALMIYVVVNIITLGIFMPWLFTAVSQVSSQPNLSDIKPFSEMARLMQGWLSYGMTFEDSLGSMGFVIYFFLIFGLIIPQQNKSRDWWRMLLPIVWVIVSVAVYSYLDLYARYMRFLLPAQIGIAVWMGRGAWILWRVIPRAANRPEDMSRQAILSRNMPKIAAFVAVAAYSYTLLQGVMPLYSDPDFQRDDYRRLAQIIESEGQQGDAIILSSAGLQEIFGYYYHGDLPIYPLPSGDDIAGDTRAVIAEHRRIFTVLYGNEEQDPDGILTTTLKNEAYQINDEWVDNIKLQRYARPANFQDIQEVDIQFGESITLESYALGDTTVRPNDALQLQLQWVTDSKLETRYKVFVQLLNSDGGLVAQRDSEPAGGEAITTLWQVGETVTDNHALSIPADLSAGDYTLIIGLYDANNPSARLSVNDGDYLELATVQVE